MCDVIFMLYTAVQCYLDLFSCLKTHKFIYVSWLKYAILKQTNGDKLNMFLLLKGHLAQQTNTLLSDQYRLEPGRLESSYRVGALYR